MISVEVERLKKTNQWSTSWSHARLTSTDSTRFRVGLGSKANTSAASWPIWLGIGHKGNTSKGFHWFDGSPFEYNGWYKEPDYKNHKYWAVYFDNGMWEWFQSSAFYKFHQMCSINLKASTSYEKTLNPADTKETLVSKQCPNSTWIRRGNKCYFIKREKADFYENIALCNHLNASLVSISNDAENIHVTQLMLSASKHASLWLGLGRSSNNSKEFYWFDGSPFVYNNWFLKAPEKRLNKYRASSIGLHGWFEQSAFSLNIQMCSINLKAGTTYKRTPNPAGIEETLVTKQCPNATWIRYGNKCYFVKREEADLYQNIALCNQLNASLVSITSEEENLQVTRLMKLELKVNSLWLGLGKKPNASEEFYWFDGGPFIYNSWSTRPKLIIKYFGAYIKESEWFIDTALKKRTQVCYLNLNWKTSLKHTHIPFEIKETEGHCPNKTWKRMGNKCIFFNTTKEITYMENHALCKKLNATMVSIHSEAENIQLSRLSGSEHFWIGLKRASNSDWLYQWEDGSLVTFESWRDGDSRYFDLSFYAGTSHAGQWFAYPKHYLMYPCCQIYVAADEKQPSVKPSIF